MKIDPALARLVADTASAPANAEIARRAIGLLDLTSLNEDDTDERIRALCAKAVTPAGAVAAVCVYPRFVALSRELLAGTPVKVATVVNFPAGGTDPDALSRDMLESRDADEIDMVLPWRALLAGDEAPAIEMVAQCRDMCRGKTLKVILETGGLAEEGPIRRASAIALEMGADFLKTSTGKMQPAATPEAAAVMMDAIRGFKVPADRTAPIGFKAAGGIRTAQDAARYLALAEAIMGPGWPRPETFRFGASGLLDNLLATLGAAPRSTPPSSGY